MFDVFNRFLGYHGFNLVFSFACGGILLCLFSVSIASVFLCGLGVILFYYIFELSRYIAVFDITCSIYFFDKINVVNNEKLIQLTKNKIFIPNAESKSIINKLREYATDCSMFKILFYLMLLKLPCALVLSLMSIVLFAGILSAVLSPLMFFIEPDYFNNDNFCLFGSKTEMNNSNVSECDGWAIDSFGSTVAIFLLFAPLVPISLHFCRYTASLLFRVTVYFLTLDLGYSKPPK